MELRLSLASVRERIEEKLFGRTCRWNTRCQDALSFLSKAHCVNACVALGATSLDPSESNESLHQVRHARAINFPLQS